MAKTHFKSNGMPLIKAEIRKKKIRKKYSIIHTIQIKDNMDLEAALILEVNQTCKKMIK